MNEGGCRKFKMKTLALRFGETFSPKCGTIKAHQQVIDVNGFVWYGKSGAPVADQKIAEIKNIDVSKILEITTQNAISQFDLEGEI